MPNKDKIKIDLKMVIVVKGDECHYEMENVPNLSYQQVALGLIELERMKKRLLEFEFQPEYEIEEFDEGD